jgi:hypothetical protein
MLTIRDSQKQTMAQSSPNRTMVQACPLSQTWIEVKLVDEDGNPVPDQKYKIVLPDGSIQEGSLDDKGTVRFDGITPGDAQVTFPELDTKEWKQV